MRIAYNGRYLMHSRMTGVERVGFNLLKNIVQLDMKNEYEIFTGPGNGLVRLQCPQNVHIHESAVLRYNKALQHGWEQFQLPRLVHQGQYDLLFNPANTGPVIGGTASILFLCDVSFMENPQWFSKGFRALYGTLVPRAARKARRIITISASSKSEIVRHLGVEGSRISVVYPAVDRDFLDLSPVSLEELRGRLGINKPYILFVGSLDPRKNLKNLVLAFRKLHDEIAGSHDLLVVGAANASFADVNVAGSAADSGIKFIGHVDDASLKALYSGAELFVYPSLYEGFGLPPLEAMSCGTPVIVSRVTSLPEVCGDAAYYIDPTDTDSIAGGIRELLSNGALRKTLAEKGLRRAGEFSWEKAAQDTLRVIEGIQDETGNCS